MKTIVNLFILLVLLGILFGCGAFSATTLRCGTEGDTSYVEIVSAPQTVANNTRALSELCGFAYEKEENE